MRPSDELTRPDGDPALDPTELAEPAPSDGRPTEESIPPPPRAASEAELPAGTKLGDYVIEGKIGAGGMGEVYAARHPLIGKRAAIKVVRKELCSDESSVGRFVDEARVVNQIGHPNIVDVFAFGTTRDGRSYLVMEWLQGETLRGRLERTRLELDEICELMLPLVRALQAAHDSGVVHRDLKPDNLFLVEVRGERPILKLLDFGIAKLHRPDHRVAKTATGAIVGTPQYIAPEQARGQPVDGKADIYALGGILFELLSGRPPFIADNAMDMVAKHLMEQPQRVSRFVGVPSALDDLVLAMLAKEAAERPTLAQVAAVIEKVKADGARRTSPYEPERESYTSIVPTARRPVVPPQPMTSTADAPPVSMTSTVPPPARRTTWFVPVLALAASGLVAFASVSQLGGDKAPPEAPTTAPVQRKTESPTFAPVPAPTASPAPPAPPAAAAIPSPPPDAAPASVEPAPPPPSTTKRPLRIAKPGIVKKPEPVKKPESAKPETRQPSVPTGDDLAGPGTFKRSP
ncbi:MAG: protein kinase [Kofleriaceae bacterium]|nr:protein kinase [Kofleriaceae bacterium]